jgi:hypothetical protein
MGVDTALQKDEVRHKMVENTGQAATQRFEVSGVADQVRQGDIQRRTRCARENSSRRAGTA